MIDKHIIDCFNCLATDEINLHEAERKFNISETKPEPGNVLDYFTYFVTEDD